MPEPQQEKPKKKYDYPLIKWKNPVIEMYRGERIFKYNRINLRVSAVEKKRLIDAKIDFGLSERQAIEEKGILCPCSGPVIIQRSVYGKGS
jgi:hypothetical protein